MFGFLTSGELALAATSLSDCWPLQLCWLCPVGGQSWQYQQFCHWTHLSTRQWISWSRRTGWPMVIWGWVWIQCPWTGLVIVAMALRLLLWSVFYVCRLSRGRLVRVTDSFVHMHSMSQAPRFFLPWQSMLLLWWLSVAPLAPTMSVFISVKTALSSTQTLVLFLHFQSRLPVYHRKLWWRHWGPHGPTVSEKRSDFFYSLRFCWQQPWKNPYSHLDHCHGLFPSCPPNFGVVSVSGVCAAFQSTFFTIILWYIRIPFFGDLVHIVNLKLIVQVEVHYFVTQGFWFYQCPFHDRLIGVYQCFQRGKSHWRTVVENRLC